MIYLNNMINVYLKVTETPSDLYPSNVTLYAITLNSMRLKFIDIELPASLSNCLSKSMGAPLPLWAHLLSFLTLRSLEG